VTSVKLGLRNLARNRWRTGLTLAAVAVAVGLMIWTLAFYEGWIDELVRGSTAVETGQLQIHTAAHVDQPRAYRSFSPGGGLLDRIRSVPGVRAVSPRVELDGLVGNEERSQVARIRGVDPELEAAATPLDEAVVEGRWLSGDPPPRSAPREVVLGSGLARRLRVGPGAELVTFLEAADGSLGNELLRVVGVVETGNTRVDRLSAFLHLRDAQRLGALEGEIHEIALRTDDLEGARETAASLAEALGGGAVAAATGPPGPGVPDDALVVRPWQELLPGIEQMILIFRRSYWIVYLLVYLLAAVGIVNTQRMSALEREREFGVMMAVGMRPRRMFRTLLVETGVLGVAGALLGAMAGTSLAWYHATRGFDMGMVADQTSFSYMGVAFSERIFFVLRPEHVVEPVLIMGGVALLSGLWPAIRAARVDPAPTIAGRTG